MFQTFKQILKVKENTSSIEKMRKAQYKKDSNEDQIVWKIDYLWGGGAGILYNYDSYVCPTIA